MKKLTLALFLLLLVLSTTAKNPKYIFLFIGDGMGLSHIALTEAAIASSDKVNGFVPLNFTNFPIVGFVTTHAANRLTTDSAAGGTALASGQKTSVNTIGMNTDRTRQLPSIAEIAKENGMKVGIVTSVSIDHATPAAFYAHEPDRNMYYEIASWMTRSSFDLYAGSGMLKPIREKNIYDEISSSGYKIIKGSGVELNGSKIYWEQETGANPANIPLAIDCKDGDLTLQEMTEKAIEFLDNDKGFFVMIEGGLIDWAAHSNDAASIVHETKKFADAIDIATDFYNKHPEETLIIVTADHETGGLALGLGGRGYDTDFSLLFNQRMSKGKLEDAVKNSSDWSEAKNIIKNNLGFWENIEISEKEEENLFMAYKEKSEKAATLGVNMLQARAGVGFTSGSHTATPVPFFVIGSKSDLFKHIKDNVEIPRQIDYIITNHKKLVLMR